MPEPGAHRLLGGQQNTGSQLVAAGEHVVDVQPKLAARVRLLATGATNKNDPNDARSVAIAALRSPAVKEVAAEDHTAVMKVWAKRHRDLSQRGLDLCGALTSSWPQDRGGGSMWGSPVSAWRCR